jgi:hypothetical protein
VVYPLSVVHSKRYIAPRLALAGDAAHAIHPIAGQGFNIGLRDVAALAEVIMDTLRLGLDPGTITALERYERWRKPDNMMMIGVTDVLNRLFSNDIPPIRIARDIGLAAVDNVAPLKKGINAPCHGSDRRSATPDPRRTTLIRHQAEPEQTQPNQTVFVIRGSRLRPACLQRGHELRPTHFVLGAQLMKIPPRENTRIVQVVKNDPDRIVADCLDIGNADMTPAGNQNLLPRSVSLHFSRRAFNTQIFRR